MNANLESYANKVLAAPVESLPGGMASATTEPVMAVFGLVAAAVAGATIVVEAYAYGATG